MQAEDRAEARVAATNGDVDELQALGTTARRSAVLRRCALGPMRGAWRGAPGPGVPAAHPLEEAG
jgi:hypothetical protein